MLQPVILCGGDGTRLWPASRRGLPKQFMPLRGGTLYKNTLARAAGLPDALPPVIVCNQELRFLAAAQAQEVMQPAGAIILEPVGRNTAPAIAVAALHAEALGRDPVLLVLPSDHDMPDAAPLARAVREGLPAARQGMLVTFGIMPDRPETGYGYIRKGHSLGNEAFEVESFVEKPDQATAEQFFRSGEYLWNSGMFLFRASAYLTELSRYSPEIFAAASRAYDGLVRDLDFLRLDKAAFEACPADSIDYAVMERTGHAAVVPFAGAWSDLGSWESLYATGELDPQNNSITGDVLALESDNSFFMSQSRLVAALGLSDMVVVETADAVLVAPKERSQEVRKLVDILRAGQRPEVEQHRVRYRPWGRFETIAQGDRFQVKSIVVWPGHSLSLQKHLHRAEHWVVVRGTALVTRNDKERTLSEDQSTYIPVGVKHRLSNPGKVPLEIIEIQTGGYLGEDDIHRFDDVYNRQE